jgi:SWIM zinc finger
VHRSSDFSAEVQHKDKRWEVNLHDRQCTCREWQVKGIPCVHAAAFIATFRNVKWEEYVDSHFTVAQFKAAYSMGVASMPSKHEWLSYDLGFKLLPPVLKRPAGRPRKNRIKASDETKKKSNKCSRCGLFGHHKNTCKNTVSEGYDEESSQVTQATQGLSNKRLSHHNS